MSHTCIPAEAFGFIPHDFANELALQSRLDCPACYAGWLALPNEPCDYCGLPCCRHDLDGGLIPLLSEDLFVLGEGTL